MLCVGMLLATLLRRTAKAESVLTERTQSVQNVGSHGDRGNQIVPEPFGLWVTHTVKSEREPSVNRCNNGVAAVEMSFASISVYASRFNPSLSLGSKPRL